MFRLAAEVLSPVYVRLLRNIARAQVLWADETPPACAGHEEDTPCHLWIFLTQNEKGEWLIGYRFSMSRAGKTPKDVLGSSMGKLVVDAYTG